MLFEQQSYYKIINIEIQIYISTFQCPNLINDITLLNPVDLIWPLTSFWPFQDSMFQEFIMRLSIVILGHFEAPNEL